MSEQWLTTRLRATDLSREELEEITGVSRSRLETLATGDEQADPEEVALLTPVVGDPLHPFGVSIADAEAVLWTGGFAYVPGNDMGLGKVEGIEDGMVTLEYFHAPSRREERRFGREEVSAARVSLQTRCYVYDDEAEQWRTGRTGTHLSDGTIEVNFPRRQSDYLPVEEVYVRCMGDPADPVETLARKGHETGFFHHHRSVFVRSLVRQRALSLGMTGMLSGSVDLLAHQLETVRRVLTDPVQRYLLADEVGLGKTIEAGAIIRQHLIDHPRAQVLVLVPAQLVGQWRRELDEKFHVLDEPRRVHVEASEEAADLSTEGATLLVIDEAHHVARWARDGSGPFEEVRERAHGAEKLLLLSATPALNNEREFLTMLHLLDPVSYQVNEVEAFRERLDKRREVGEVLLSMDEDLPVFLLQTNVERLRDAFPEDDYLERLTDQLDDALEKEEAGESETDGQERRRLVRAIQLHVSETYRLHRRMIRSRRERVGENDEERVLIGRSGEMHESKGLRAEPDMDEREERAHELLDEWRLEALRTASDEQEKSALIDLFTVFVSALGCDLDLLKKVVQARLGEKENGLPEEMLRPIREAPTVGREEELLREVERWASDPIQEFDYGKVECLKMLIDYAKDDFEKVVVFASLPSTAERVTENLRGELGEEAVAVQHEEMETAPMAELKCFEEEDECFVLVCDRSGEEGHNLQFADLLVHYDLPLSPNRIEQRTGRLDRIGRERGMCTRVLIGPDLDEEGGSFMQAWFEVLEDGFQIFEESIASLQFFVDKQLPELKRRLFEGGPEALRAEIETIRDSIEEEEREIRNQDAIDAVDITAAAERAGFVDKLKAFDSEGGRREHEMDPWISEALHFDKKRQKDGTIQYAPSSNTLVPMDLLLNRFLPHMERNSTYHRQQATHNSETRLFRLGNGLINDMADYLDWDDRGRAFAFWRQARNWPSEPGAEWAGFQFDFVVEADLSEARELVEAEGSSFQSFRRRADYLFPPFSETLYLQLDGGIEDRDPVLNLLKRSFQNVRDGGADTNLHRERLSVIDEFVESSRWEKRCHEAREQAETHLRASEGFSRLKAEAEEAARRDVQRHIERLRLRMRSMEGEESKDLERQKRIGEALIEGVERPQVTVDAIGFIVVSGRESPIERVE